MNKAGFKLIIGTTGTILSIKPGQLDRDLLKTNRNFQNHKSTQRKLKTDASSVWQEKDGLQNQIP